MHLLQLLEAFGGLGLFVFGMKTMSDGFQHIASGTFRRFIEKIGGNRFSAAASGCALSSLFQSSGAASVMIIGFVNAGLVTFYQALAMLIGTGFGTVIAVQFISFKIHVLSLPLIFFGTALRYFGRRRRLILVGEIFMGIGLVFLGLEIMESRFSPFESAFSLARSSLSILDWHVISVLAGTVLTLLVQSGSVAIGIVIALAASGVLGLEQSIAMAIGEVLGTSIMAAASSLGGTGASKRASMLYGLLSVTAVTLALLLFPNFLALVQLLSQGIFQTGATPAGASVSHLPIGREIANGYALFVVLLAAASLPFIGLFARMAGAVDAAKNGTADLAPRSRYLDFRVINTPYLAYLQSTNEFKRMAQVAGSMVSDTVGQFHDFSEKISTLIRQKETLLDVLQKDLSAYLVELGRHSVSEEISSPIHFMLDAVNELESIGDCCETIIVCLERKKDESVFFSDVAMSEIKALARDVVHLVSLAVDAVEDHEISAKDVVRQLNDAIAHTAVQLKENHLRRLSSGTCTVIAGLLYMDIVETFARIGGLSFALISKKGTCE